MKLKSYNMKRLAFALFFSLCSTTSFTQNIFTKNAIKHIFEGEVKTNSQGFKNASGCHHHLAIESGKVRYIKNSLVQGPNKIYKAKIEILDNQSGQWIAKKANRGFSTFFPKEWTKETCIKEISLAYEKRKKVEGTQNEFRAFSQKGNFEIVMYLTDKLQIISAFPKDWQR
ncbi:MAG: EndoU domain-containing protein [Cytophagales bacterium]